MNKKTREKRKIERQRIKAWHKYYEMSIAEEKHKRSGYEELAAVHSAYITILLKKLGATEDNAINVTTSEVKEALDKYEARAIPTENGYGLYCEVVKDDVQAKATTVEREEKN